MKPHTQILEVWGDIACFTMPALKVERFSYPIITPSAARGIFDSICVNRHKYGWRVTRIEMLLPPRYIALMRNEVQNKAPGEDTILRWAAGSAQPEPLRAGAGSDIGTPRQTMALKNVRYRLHAHINPFPEYAPEIVGMEAKFRRRAAAGQCFQQPYLGCREFLAYFRLLEPTEAIQPPAAYSQTIGWMLYDVFDLSRPGASTDAAFISAFNADVQSGVMNVPEFESDAVRKPIRK